MKRAPLLVLAGTVAGFIGVLSFHTRPAGLVTSGTRAGSGTSDSTSAAAPKATPARRPPAGGGAVRTALGAEEQFNYGVLDVQVTVRATRIIDVSVPTLRVAEPTSQQICEQAIPMLRSEVLSAQSASIDAVSGATFTSEAYAQSLQAALDQLHLK
jgi:uncharacterized protein with FMN-binding domain